MAKKKNISEVDLVKIGRDMKIKKMDLGLTIEEIADKSGISKMSIHGIFKGEIENPTIQTLEKLAKVLKMKMILKIE